MLHSTLIQNSMTLSTSSPSSIFLSALHKSAHLRTYIHTCIMYTYFIDAYDYLQTFSWHKVWGHTDYLQSKILFHIYIYACMHLPVVSMMFTTVSPGSPTDTPSCSISMMVSGIRSVFSLTSSDRAENWIHLRVSLGAKVTRDASREKSVQRKKECRNEVTNYKLYNYNQ